MRIDEIISNNVVGMFSIETVLTALVLSPRWQNYNGIGHYGEIQLDATQMVRLS